MTDNLIEVTKLRKEFGGLVATNDIDFTIPRGSIVSLIGPNGAGKTTFFNQLTGVYKPTSGIDRVRRGRRLGQAAARDHRARDRPHVPEHPALHADDRARERARRDALPPARRDPRLDRAHEEGDGARRRRRATRRASCSSTAACRGATRSRPALCPTATSAGSRSRAPLPPTRSCCCSTSRRPA